MQLSRLNPRIIILSFLFLIFFGLCSKADGQDQQPRGEIRVVESWRPDINVLGHNVLQYLYEYALDRNELVPCLAVSRRWVDDTTLELKLREGVRFHNGEPFDAEAVRFNVTYQRQHNLGRGVQVYMKNLAQVRVIDPYTVQMVLDQPDSLFLDKLIIGPTAGWVIGAPQYVKRVGWSEFLRRPIGTGPYMVEGEVKDYRKAVEGETYATLAAHSDYWNKGYPKIRKIRFMHHSPNEALSALVEGRVDLVTSMIPKDTLKVEVSQHSKVVKGRQNVIWTSGLLNMMSPHTLPLRNMRVREALNYAVNREELIRYAFKGNALIMRGFLTENCGVDLSETEPYNWNIMEGRKLMNKAGYREGFKMKLCYQEKNHLIAQLLQRFFSLLKIETEIRSVDWEWLVRHIVYPNTRKGYSWENEDWWIVIFSQPGYVPELVAGMLEWAYRYGAPWQYFPDWLLEPLHRMYQEVLRTTDHAKRFQLYKKINEYLADQALGLFTVAPLSLYGVNEELHFVPQVSQYLYLDHSSVSDNHWSLRGKNH